MVFRKSHGEKRDDDQPDSDEWIVNTLPEMFKHYKPCDVFNDEKTGLYFRILLGSYQVMKESRQDGGNKSKERLYVLVCDNMDRTPKYPLLVIGKSAKPRCFCGCKNFPCDYSNKRSAWMT